jgi:hypothetical protein
MNAALFGDLAVGILTTIGRIDLRDVWTDIQKAGAVTTDAKNAVRNRCVLPMLEKLDAGQRYRLGRPEGGCRAAEQRGESDGHVPAIGIARIGRQLN